MRMPQPIEVTRGAAGPAPPEPARPRPADRPPPAPEERAAIVALALEPRDSTRMPQDAATRSTTTATSARLVAAGPAGPGVSDSTHAHRGGTSPFFQVLGRAPPLATE
jgi:hypothetical protein